MSAHRMRHAQGPPLARRTRSPIQDVRSWPRGWRPVTGGPPAPRFSQGAAPTRTRRSPGLGPKRREPCAGSRLPRKSRGRLGVRDAVELHLWVAAVAAGRLLGAEAERDRCHAFVCVVCCAVVRFGLVRFGWVCLSVCLSVRLVGCGRLLHS